jgi:predicted phage terminase large subunit-like protein
MKPTLGEDELSEVGLIGSLVKDSFYEFVKEFWSVIIQEKPVFGWYVKVICDEMQTVAERVFNGEEKEYDLVINVPPGSTKSTICSQMFPAWVWTRMPSAKFICASYAHSIALKDSLKTRDIVESELYQRCFGIRLREDQNTKGLFANNKMGFRFSTSIEGSVTGFHGHFLLVDDPLNPEASYSDAELKTTNRWMSTTLPSRKVNKLITPTILVQQRLHQADPSGEMLEKGESDVKHLCLPGELTDGVSPKNLAQYYVDGLLDPIRLPKKVLEKIEKELGAYGYASQILQQPVPLGGGMFHVDKLVKRKTVHKKIVRAVRSWDKAGTKGGGAYSVGVLMGVDDDRNYWILDVIRGQWGSTEREEKIAKTAAMDEGMEGIYGAVETILEIEGGSGGKESGENTVRNLAGHKVFCYHPTGDKESRAYPFSSQVGAGNVYILDEGWFRDYVEELQHFPQSRFKDQVDASSGAFNRLAKKKRIVGGMSF